MKTKSREVKVIIEEIGRIANTRWEKDKIVEFPKGKRKWCIACAINLYKHLKNEHKE